MKVEENKDKFIPLEIVITIESEEEARRLRDILANKAKSADYLNSIINVLNRRL